MNDSLLFYEDARDELASLLPLRDQLSRAREGWRRIAARSSGARSDAVLRRLHRYDRTLRRLNIRIHLASDLLSGNVRLSLPAAERGPLGLH